MPGIASSAAQKNEGLAASVQKATVAYTELAAAAVPAAEAIDNVGMAMRQTSSFMLEFKKNMSLFLPGADASVSDPDFGRHERTAQENLDAARIVQQINNFKAEIESIFGTNNQFATFLGRTADSIAGGADPYAALNALRRQFSAYAGGLQQELMSQDPAIAAFAAEMERFIGGGNLE